MKRLFTIILIIVLVLCIAPSTQLAYSEKEAVSYLELNHMLTDAYQELSDNDDAAITPISKDVNHFYSERAWTIIGREKYIKASSPVKRDEITIIISKFARDPLIINNKDENICFKTWVSSMNKSQSATMAYAEVKKGLDIICDTELYIRHLDVNRFEKQGADYTNPRYSPLRLGKGINDIDIVYNYDFNCLARVEKELENVDRRKVLRNIFNQVTRTCHTDYDKHLALLEFLQKISFNNVLQPMYSNKTMVTDPLILLELGEMRCGQVARLGVDLFAVAGYHSRLVQLGQHVIAEVYYDNSWHYLDADLFGGGEVITNQKIPSIVEMSKTPYIIDALSNYYELNYKGMPAGQTIYPSLYYFGKILYKSTGFKGLYYYKTATEEQELNKFYGWNYYKTVVDEKRNLSNLPTFYQPSYPSFIKIETLSDGKEHIEWNPSVDSDKDILGYRVYMSSYSRGWDYSQFMGSDSSKKYWSNTGGWNPEMYDKLFQLPPHDKGLITTDKTFLNLDLKKGEIYYITIMPYDRHGESVGKKLYRMSNEIKISA